MKNNLFIALACYFFICFVVLIAVHITDKNKTINQLTTEKEALAAELAKPTPTPTNTPTPTPTATPTSTPTPTPAGEITQQQFYNECVNRGIVTPANAEDDRITKERGGYMGPSGRETYYNLKMDLVVYYMRELGYDEINYPYWIRDDGAKMLGLYVMAAANWKTRPRGTLLETSLGTAIVVDTGEFVADYPNGVDLAVDW